MNKILLTSLILIMGGCNSENNLSSLQGKEIEMKESPLITRYIMGKADKKYYDAEARVAKRWNINLEHKLGGLMGKEKSKERLLLEAQTLKANNYYSQKFGENWQEKFKKEVLEEKIK
jgi:hypothetical protein